MKHKNHETRDSSDSDKLSIREEVVDICGRVFTFGNVPDKPLNELFEALSQRPIHGTRVLESSLAVIDQALPRSIRERYRGDVFAKIPLKLPGTDQKIKLKPIGSGTVNNVYLLEGDTRSWSVGIRRKSFDNEEEAFAYAARQEEEYKTFSTVFSGVDNLIPQETRVVYERHDGKPGIMYLREYTEPPILDIFEVPQDKLVELLSQNQQLLHTIKGFVSACINNLDTIIEDRLDLVGRNNLVISGAQGNERLVLMDAHSYWESPTDNENTVRERVEYLAGILDKIPSSE